MKKISLMGLKKMMPPKEMKNVLGGSEDGDCAAGVCTGHTGATPCKRDSDCYPDLGTCRCIGY